MYVTSWQSESLCPHWSPMLLPARWVVCGAVNSKETSVQWKIKPRHLFLYFPLSEFQQLGKALDTALKFPPRSRHATAATSAPERSPHRSAGSHPRCRQLVSSTMFQSPIFIGKKKKKSERKERNISFPSSIMVTFLHFLVLNQIAITSKCHHRPLFLAFLQDSWHWVWLNFPRTCWAWGTRSHDFQWYVWNYDLDRLRLDCKSNKLFVFPTSLCLAMHVYIGYESVHPTVI